MEAFKRHDQPSIVSVIEQHAEQWPDRSAYVFVGKTLEQPQTLSYRELVTQVHQRASVLRAAGLTGARAALMFPVGLAFVIDFLACLKAGVVAVPLTLTRNVKQLQRTLAVFKDAQVSAVLSTSSTAPQIQQYEHLLPVPNNGQALQWFTEAHRVEAASADDCPALTPDALAFIQYTSGSTGQPKGVMVSHRNILANQNAIQRACGHTAGLIGGGWLPQFHDMGLIGQMLQPVFLGGTSVFMSPLHFVQHPARWLKLMSHFECASATAPNFGYAHCVQHVDVSDPGLKGLDLSAWKVALNGAEPVCDKTMRAFADKFARFGFDASAFLPCYGMAETTLLVSGGPSGAGAEVARVDRTELAAGRWEGAIGQEGSAVQSIVCCGAVDQAYEVVIVDPETHQRCGPEAVGEIWVRGEGVAQGYWRNPELTEQVFQAQITETKAGSTPSLSEDADRNASARRYLRTGDLGYLQAGRLYVTGRIKDLIIVRGRNLYPYDMERTLAEHPLVHRQQGAAVFSWHTPQVQASGADSGRERVGALVQLPKRRLAEENLEALERDLMGRIMESYDIRLDAIALVKPGTIPRTTSGKIKRNACSDVLNEALRGAEAASALSAAL